MTTRILRAGAFACAIVLPFACSAPAVARPEPAVRVPCGDRALLFDRLARQYGESVIGRGLDAAGGLVELLRSPSGSWTLALTRPEGPTCIVAVGEGWDRPPPAAPGTDS